MGCRQEAASEAPHARGLGVWGPSFLRVRVCSRSTRLTSLPLGIPWDLVKPQLLILVRTAESQCS